MRVIDLRSVRVIDLRSVRVIDLRCGPPLLFSERRRGIARDLATW